jgi:hypothetical protein
MFGSPADYAFRLTSGGDEDVWIRNFLLGRLTLPHDSPPQNQKRARTKAARPAPGLALKL